jgi:hypothetical protein
VRGQVPGSHEVRFPRFPRFHRFRASPRLLTNWPPGENGRAVTCRDAPSPRGAATWATARCSTSASATTRPPPLEPPPPPSPGGPRPHPRPRRRRAAAPPPPPPWRPGLGWGRAGMDAGPGSMGTPGAAGGVGLLGVWWRPAAGVVASSSAERVMRARRAPA